METKPEITKSKLTEDQIMIRSIRGMSNRQMTNRLRRLTKKTYKSSGKMDQLWAIVLLTVLENMESGKISAYLR